jgi:acetyl-CoA carboxylase biotin carboxyl carrier protein
MVGTFYAAPAPDAQEFVKVGDTVRRGQKVAIVEAMKIMNEIEAEYDCKILEILVKDGEVVDFDKPLFSVEKL